MFFQCTNRTILELKPKESGKVNSVYQSTNRTILELKPDVNV